LPFVGFAVLLFLDGFLELFFGFWSFSCASCGLRFEIQTLCLCVVNVLIKGEIEKSSGQYLGLNLNPRNFSGSTKLSVLCVETCLLVS
jgi:hypothetical protein